MSSEPSASPRRSAWRAALARPGILQALLPAAVLFLFAIADPSLFEELKLKGFDIAQRISPRAQNLDLPVVIVAIDEPSLVAPYGQWPWPRTQVAQLVRKIAAAKPLALAVDIIFSEPDRMGPQILASLPGLSPSARDALAQLPDNDAELAAAFKEVPTVLGIGTSFETQAPAQGHVPVTPMRAVGGDPSPYVQTYPALVRSLPILLDAETGGAALAGEPDRDGIVRRVPLLIEAGGTLVPGLTAETLRVATRARAIGVVSGSGGIEGLVAGGYFLPADGKGRAYPYFAPPQSTLTFSAADILSGRIDPKALTGRIVLMGLTGLGLVDVKQTPLGLMQGIEVHAHLLQSILAGDVLRRPVLVSRLETALIVVTAFFVVLVFPYGRPLFAVSLLGALVIWLLGGEFIAFRMGHVLIDGVYPAIASLASYGVMTAANFRATEGARRRLADALEREREQTARLEGELNAAHAIQMGLLPRPLPRVPETSRIDVHQLIEVARMVGGDLYDFVMLDPRRLYFAIADVSGKGVDAAIFMAMTKTVLGGACLQHGEALDRVFVDSNTKLAETSDHIRTQGGRPMFVTVFAAVLELDTGIIHYASAGHDSPYLLRAGEAPGRLDSAGGPPLGAMDEFPFPVDRAQLTPGDVLVLYTDGVTEAKDEAGAFYTTARLDRLMAGLEPATARAAVESVHDDLRGFVGAAEQADDITLLAVRWLGPFNVP